MGSPLLAPPSASVVENPTVGPDCRRSSQEGVAHRRAPVGVLSRDRSGPVGRRMPCEIPLLSQEVAEQAIGDATRWSRSARRYLACADHHASGSGKLPGCPMSCRPPSSALPNRRPGPQPPGRPDPTALSDWSACMIPMPAQSSKDGWASWWSSTARRRSPTSRRVHARLCRATSAGRSLKRWSRLPPPLAAPERGGQQRMIWYARRVRGMSGEQAKCIFQGRRLRDSQRHPGCAGTAVSDHFCSYLLDCRIGAPRPQRSATPPRA